MHQPHQGEPSESRTRPGLAALTIALGILWSAAWLTWAGALQYGEWTAAARPFVYRHVLMFHLLGVVPLTLWCGAWLVQQTGRSITLRSVAWLMGLVCAPLAAVAIVPVVDVLQAVAGADLFLFDIARLTTSFLLVLPWGIASATAWTWPRDGRRLFLLDGVIVALLAGLPVLNVHQLIERRMAVRTEAVRNDQWVSDVTILRQLGDLGAELPGDVSLGQYVTAQERRIAAIRQAVQTPLTAEATRDERLARARLHFQLGEFSAARDLIANFAAADPRAAVRLGLMSEWSRDWADAAAHYEVALKLLDQTGIDSSSEDGTPDSLASDTRTPDSRAPTAEQLHLVRLATERRVNNLRRIGQTFRAERELRQGLERWPSARDSFLLQLGFHYKMAGRHGEAGEFFRQAAAVNPQLTPLVERELADARNQAEGCLFRPVEAPAR